MSELRLCFYSYGVICSHQMLLWHILDFQDDQPARSGSQLHPQTQIYTTT